MTAKERDRLKVLQEVKKRHITQKQGSIGTGAERALGADAAEDIISLRGLKVLWDARRRKDQ